MTFGFPVHLPAASSLHPGKTLPPLCSMWIAALSNTPVASHNFSRDETPLERRATTKLYQEAFL
jgi:hypothetical protein